MAKKKRKNTKKVQTTKRRKYRRRNKIKINKKIWVLLLIPILLLILLVFLVFKDNEEIGKENQKPNYLTETGEKKITISLTNEDGTVIEVLEVGKDGKIKEPTIPTKEGYEFVEWQYNGTKFDFSQPITENITLIAVWKELPKAVKQYKVTFNSDGGTKVAQQFIEEGKVASIPTNPKKNGYTFVEWQLNGKKYNFNTQVTKDITLKAKWKKVEQQVQPTTPVPAPAEPAPVPLKDYTITFNSDGGTNIESQSVKEGNKATRPTDPTKTDYAFIEWQLNGTTYNFETAVTSNITLTAKWKKTTYNIGDEVQLGSEQFYVIGTFDEYGKGTKVTLFAKYTLGPNYRQSTMINNVKFSNNKGWTNPSVYIDIQGYDGPVKTYVNSYKTYLNSVTGNKIQDVSLISRYTLNSLGCKSGGASSGGTYGKYILGGQPYWTRTSLTGSSSIIVVNGTSCSSLDANRKDYNLEVAGVRPVVTIYASDL